MRCDHIESASAVFDDALLARLGNASRVDAFVAAGVRAIVESNGQLSMRELTSALGIGERQFQRLFRAEVGLTPKQFSRIRRLRSAMVDAIKPQSPDWSQIACEHGFADQAHLTREFSHLAGFAPTTFQQRVSHIAHGRLDP
jgi:AraC-like DNA-binding protein